MTAGDIRVVVSGSSWMGGGSGSIDSALHGLFTRANNEVIIVAFSVSGGATELFELFAQVLRRGVRIRMLINRYDGQHVAVQNRLAGLHRQFPRLLQLYSFVPEHEQADLHAKAIIVDRTYALVGLANLSLRGFMENHELGLLVEGAAVADIARAVDQLLGSRQAVMVKFPGP